MKLVDFTYCKQCKYKDQSDQEPPCDDCLATPENQFSHKPIKFEEAPIKKPDDTIRKKI